VTNDSVTIDLTLVSHTNAGKTTLARTLLGREIGEVRDAPHVTEVAESYTLLEASSGDVLRLWDTPGFGDSARLAVRLHAADNPIGWMLREVWDRYRNRPLWCSQQAVRAVRESADVVLYLVNAAEDPADAGYVVPEMQILTWVGKPVVVLLNQVGPPRPAAAERAEIDRWRNAVSAFAIVREVLALDAFARCWVQEGVLLRLLASHLPAEKQPAMRRLVAQWNARNIERFRQSMQVLTQQLLAAAHDNEIVAAAPPADRARRLLASLGFGERETDQARAAAMAQLAERADREIRTSTDRLIALHGLEGEAASVVLERLAAHYRVTEPMSEGKAAAAGGIAAGALLGLKADLAAGGLTFGAGVLAGTILGALGGAGVARGHNIIRGAEKGSVAWSPAFLDGLVRSALLRYLAVAHFGRGRGAWAEAESPAFWKDEVGQVVDARKQQFEALWDNARASDDSAQAESDLRSLLVDAATQLLERLYPGAVPEIDRST
jgi:GTPase Era involved in 16S rRNA processing